MKHTLSGRSSFAALALCAAVSAVPGVLERAHAQSSVAPQARITQAINDQNLVQLKGNTPPFTRHASDLGVAGDSLALTRLQLVLKRSDAQETALEKLLHDQQTSGSASYHKWLTPETFGSTYGVAQSDIGKVTAWLTQHGFTIDGVSNGRNIITFSGTEAQLHSAFHTEIHQYSINGQKHYANASDPLIPAALAPVVSGFAALTNYGKTPMHTASRLATRAPGGKWQQASTQPVLPSETTLKGASPQFAGQLNGHTYNLLAPGDFGTIYNVKPLWNQQIDGSGQSIAIVAQSDVNPADVDAFRTAFGLPAKKMNTIYVGDNPGYTGDSVEGEADLDVEWSGAIAPNATIDLIVSGETNTSGGVSEAAQYAVDNNVAPILSVSWGGCELGLGVSGNQFFNGMWQQAAAEGITVLVAAGDSGSASCDQNQELAQYGEQVSGFASTPYNTAVGGTDFYGNYQHASQYWSTTNGANGSSALSYIPESPWNETCASTLVLGAAQQNGFAADQTNEALCNDFTAPFLDTAGGGGGASRCTTSDASDPSSCTGGYPRPDWQLTMPGMPQNGVRNLPDISFFSGSGLWGSAYLFCQSDATPDSTCNYQNGDLDYLVAGGTSFATPAFAGVVALMSQKAQTQLGNINYSLYQMGAAQYASNGPAVYHDVAIDNNATPCLVGTIAVPPGTPCSVTNPDDEVGLLPDFNANAGYDLATGLGSADVSALLDAWGNTIADLSSTTTTLKLNGSTTFVYGTPLQAQIQVTPASGGQLPTGGIALFDQDTIAGTPLGSAQLSNGMATITENLLPAGTHTLYARYAGDGVFGNSTSNSYSVTVNAAATTLTLSASQTTVAPDASVLVKVNIGTATSATSPTGNVVLTNTATGQTLATIPLIASTDAATNNSIAYGTVNIPGKLLAGGANVINAAYAGDNNYSGSNGTLTVNYTAAFTVSIPQSTITLAPGATTGNTTVITVAPASGITLNPATLNFSCPGALPAGLTCTFSAPVLSAGGAVSSTLTIVLSGPLAASQSNAVAWLGTGAMTGLASIFLLGMPGRKRRRYHFLILLGALSVIASITGCSGSSTKFVENSSATTTTLSPSSSTPAFGSTLTLSAAVAPVNGSGAPSGTVTFEDGSNVLGTAQLSGGKAALTTSALTIGSHMLMASYGGDSSFTGSNSPASAVDVTLTTPVLVQVMDNLGNIATQPLTVTVK